MGATIDVSSILTKGLQSELATTDIEDGKIRFTIDTGRLYLDLKPEGSAGERVLISEFIDIYTESQIKNDVIAPLPKIYVASDTHRAFVYYTATLSWVDLAAVKPSASAVENVNKPVWFSNTTDEQPVYSSNLHYNTSTNTLTTTNLKATTAYIGNMRIQNTENLDHSHTVLIDFV